MGTAVFDTVRSDEPLKKLIAPRTPVFKGLKGVVVILDGLICMTLGLNGFSGLIEAALGPIGIDLRIIVVPPVFAIGITLVCP
jgi:hypothetical protein